MIYAGAILPEHCDGPHEMAENGYNSQINMDKSYYNCDNIRCELFSFVQNKVNRGC
jgi:hypothetical protein